MKKIINEEAMKNVVFKICEVLESEECSGFERKIVLEFLLKSNEELENIKMKKAGEMLESLKDVRKLVSKFKESKSEK